MAGTSSDQYPRWWALDRPGYGRSSGSLSQGQLLSEQAGTVYGALDDFAARHATGAGVFVGPPFGLKLGLFLAAHPRGKELLGVDGSGAAYRYEPALHPAAAQTEVRADGSVAAYASRSPRELFWGSESLYPPGTFTPGMRPIAAVPEIESRESASWPDLLPGVAAEVRVPSSSASPSTSCGGRSAARTWRSTRRCSPRRRCWSCAGSRRPATTSAWGRPRVPTT
jgi:hypothetical protein